MSGEIHIRSLGKAYRQWKSEWHRFGCWFGLPMHPREEHWVLRGISFSVHAGEAVAIVGQNGSGKSTLLKMITGTVVPSEGAIDRFGRIAAILELGMGFNQDMTGRENAYHAGGLMGHSQELLNSLMPEIEAFAEVGGYFDQPVRTYSSGMQMRVAFAIATAVRPDILIVDEALSVGDSYFQHKSFNRMRQFREQGTTLLFVSHSMEDVRTLCDRAVLLADGALIKDGLPDEVADYYNAIIAAKESASLTVEQRRNRDGWLLTRSGSNEARLVSLQLVDQDTQEPVAMARLGQRLRLLAEVEISQNIPALVLGYMLRDRLGHIVWGSNTWHTRQKLEALCAGARVYYSLDFTCTLGPGSYSFSPALVSSDTHLERNYEWIDNALVFDVVNADREFFIGSSYMDAKFSVKTTSGAAIGGE
ncbi:ABC transporter ATP-binding protein [Xanthomonas sacchari]|uniref:ABC transporter ATP-binding protein n=1 Tax=Xanthomonas sacchari TaxID=56458 RepID=UPI00225DD257|nr:ABC transporter ATP-binding protein [Xanthomonas sacchari]MCW0422195.1 Vitamin B12 import ATP-binding protein BtuD [Xanthomonas sacchari]